jgi:hypothetical protein
MRSNRRETENSPLSSLREIVREYLRTEKPPLVGEDIRHNIDSLNKGCPYLIKSIIIVIIMNSEWYRGRISLSSPSQLAGDERLF